MTLSFLRPAVLAAFAVAGLASCGGKADFEITGQLAGLKYPGLVLVETFSGQTVTITDITQTRFTFANTIEYGTEFNVIVRTEPSGQPPHQTCSPLGGNNGFAGRQASISMAFACDMTPHTVGGSIKMAAGSTGSIAGMQLINGSSSQVPLTIAAADTVYSFGGITYTTTYGISIVTQPTDQTIKCKLVPKVAQPGTDTPLAVSGTMADANVVIDIECAKI